MKPLLHSLLAGAALLTLGARAETVPVVVDTTTPICTNFMGFGVQWSAYPWFDLTDAEWQRVFDRLDFMRPPVVRVMLRSYRFCEGFDAQGNPIYNWNSPHMLKLYRLLDYCQSRHVKVILGEWDIPASQQDRPDIATDKLQPYHMDENDPRWWRIIADELAHLRRDKHYTCIQYFNFLNEPNSNSSGRIPFDRWKSGLAGLRQELTQRGLARDIQLVGPDVTFLPREGYWVDLTALQCASDVGAYDFHYYSPPADVESGYLEKFCWLKQDFIRRFDPHGGAKPFFMGEAGMVGGGPVEPQGGSDSQRRIYDHIYGVWMADYNVQCARAGLAGTIAWDLDDAMHINKDKDSQWPDVTKTRFKKWGFWNSLADEIGHPEDAKLRPWFYTWSLMSRSFPAGCRTVKTSAPWVAGLRTLAATDGANLSVVLVNDSDAAHDLRLTVPGQSKLPALLRYDYLPGNLAVDQNGFPVPKAILRNPDLAGGLKLNLPARSVIILTSLPTDAPELAEH
jgi:hypothetical protein